MSRPATPATVSAALVCIALAVAGCGVGAGDEEGTVRLTITNDYGSETLARDELEIRESDTVLRVLDRSAEITTRYSGAFVQGIDGLEGESTGGRLVDWFYSVNGVEPAVGAADFDLRKGDRVWWDRRDWTAAMRMPANVGSFPEPFVTGYEGRRYPVVVDCLGVRANCEEVRAVLTGEGAALARDGAEADPDAPRVLVGPWERMRDDEAAAQIERGPQSSGVFADFEAAGEGWRLVGLDQAGAPALGLAAGSGLVAATRRGSGPPVWVVTGVDTQGVAEAIELLDSDDLADHYAVAAAPESDPVALPVGGS